MKGSDSLARYIPVPFSITQEDKVIGGYLSMRQFSWILATGVVDLYLLVINRGYLNASGGKFSVNLVSLTIRIIFSIIFITIGLLMAFVKVKGINLDKYLLKKFQYGKRKHLIKYQR